MKNYKQTMKKINDVRVKLFDVFVEEEWFYDVRINELLLFDYVYEVELIVNENFSISGLNDVKDELSYHKLRVYDENYSITERNVKDTYSVKFYVEEIE